MRAPAPSQRRLVDELDTHGTTLDPLDSLYPYGPPPHRHHHRPGDTAPYHTRYNFLNEFLTRRVLNGARAGSSLSGAQERAAGHAQIGTLRRTRTMRERTVKTIDETGSVQPLKLEMIDCDGGSLDFDAGRYTAENLLRNDNSVYCTARTENVNILLKSARPFVLSEMVIKAPQRSFTSPVKDGLIWVSINRPILESRNHFDRPQSVTSNDDSCHSDTPLVQLLAGHDLPATTTSLGSPINHASDKHAPNAYFRISPETGTASIKFEPALSGRFVHVKLLSGQPFDSYPGRTERDNIDVQAILLYGQTGPHLKASFAFR